jgi:uncharacterized membrane protein YkvA (DUF1232 family)
MRLRYFHEGCVVAPTSGAAKGASFMTTVRPVALGRRRVLSLIVGSFATSVLLFDGAASLRAAPVVIHAGLLEPSIQLDGAGGQQLDSSARAVRKGIRKVVRHLVWWSRTWASWTWQALLFTVVALLVPLFNMDLLRTGRDQGLGRLRVAFALGLAVYVRLLIDSRSPIIGKALLALALIYGKITADLVPDTWIPFGWVDDVLAAGVAAHFFMWLCPDELVAEQAAKATEARERSLNDRIPIDSTGAHA